MVYVYLIGIPLGLLVAFLALISFEAKTGRRMFPGRRAVLDLKVARVAFVFQHVDWGAFINDIMRTTFDRALHDITHGLLIAVRAVERELTAVVRTLRARREHPGIAAPKDAQPSRLESAMSYMRRTVRRSRRQLPPSQQESAEL